MGQDNGFGMRRGARRICVQKRRLFGEFSRDEIRSILDKELVIHVVAMITAEPDDIEGQCFQLVAAGLD